MTANVRRVATGTAAQDPGHARPGPGAFDGYRGRQAAAPAASTLAATEMQLARCRRMVSSHVGPAAQTAGSNVTSQAATELS